MAALVFKIGTLAMKTLSKPLAERFRVWVMSHPEHRRTVLRMAESAHRMEVGISRRAEGKEGPAFIGAMTEEKSVELASKIASEGFVFAIGALLVFAEYNRTSKKEARKVARERAAREVRRGRGKRGKRGREGEREMGREAADDGCGQGVERTGGGCCCFNERTLHNQFTRPHTNEHTHTHTHSLSLSPLTAANARGGTAAAGGDRLAVGAAGAHRGGAARGGGGEGQAAAAAVRVGRLFRAARSAVVFGGASARGGGGGGGGKRLSSSCSADACV